MSLQRPEYSTVVMVFTLHRINEDSICGPQKGLIRPTRLDTMQIKEFTLNITVHGPQTNKIKFLGEKEKKRSYLVYFYR